MIGRGFWREAGFGLIASIAVAVLFPLLGSLLSPGGIARGLLLLIGAGYLLLQLTAAKARIGRLVVAAAWLLLAALLLAFDPPIALWVLASLALVWLVRSLYRHDSLLAALADAAITAFAVACALAAGSHSHSLFLASWTFFLVQALATLIPARRDHRQPTATSRDDRFDQAYRSAEAAVRRLSSING